MVKSKLIKNVLVCSLALSLSMASIVVQASSMGGSSMGGSTGSSSGTSAAAGTAQSEKVEASSAVVLNGKEVTSTITGCFYAPNVNGVAAITQKAEINKALGLKDGETASVRVFKSFYGPNAQQCVADTVKALQAELGPVLDINMGKIGRDGKFVNVQEIAGPVAFTVGIPNTFQDAGSSYYMIHVQPGGKITVLEDMDTDPTTVTFATTGFGVFAIAKR